MTDGDEENSGVSRRSVLALLGATGASAVGAGIWGKPFFEDIWNGRDEPGNYGGTGPSTDEPSGTDGSEYDVLNGYVPEGCGVTDEEWDAVLERVDSYDTLEGENTAGYFEEKRVDLRRQDTELELLIDEDGDGQYDHHDINIEDAC